MAKPKIKVSHKLCRFLMTDCTYPHYFGNCKVCFVFQAYMKARNPKKWCF